MRVGIVIAAVVAVVVVALALWRGRDGGSGSAPSTAAVTSPATTGSSSPPPSSGDTLASTQHIRRLSPEQRTQLAQRIAAAQAARASRGSTAPPPRPRVAEHTTDLDHLSMSVKDALTEAIPLLADCYRTPSGADAATPPTAAVMMTLTGDPDLGTLIDPDEMVDAHKQPLEPTLDDCLRSTLESLQLPPLDEGEKVQLQFSFVFD